MPTHLKNNQIKWKIQILQRQGKRKKNDVVWLIPKRQIFCLKQNNNNDKLFELLRVKLKLKK